MQRTVIILLCVMVVLVGASVSRILRSPEPAEVAAETAGQTIDFSALQQQGAFIRPEPRVLGDAQLIDAEGQRFTVESLRGQWSLVFLGYTYCPDICPITMGLFKQLHAQWQGTVLADTQFVLLSADPERDRPEKLRDYLQFFNEDFIGVTGSVDAVAAFAKQLNALFARVPQENGDYLIDHSANIMLINPAGQFHGFIRPPHSVEQIKQVLETVAAANS